MRKVVLSILVVFISIINVHAQIAKGTSMIGGSIGYNTQNNEQNNSGNTQSSENKILGITPSYGKAVRTNLVVGADLTYQNIISKNKNNGNTSEIKSNGFGVGVFARHYKNLGSSGFYLFLQSRLGVDISNSTYNTPYKSKSFNIGAGLNPGIAYAITPKMHIETGLNNLFYAGYSKSTSTSEQDPSYSSKTSAFNAGIGLGSSTEWMVGVKFFFGT
jgi:hypothetical protein